jgi:hypothetical protein
MPSCSNSSNISSAINSFNITQGSGGSRFVVQINQVAGLTVGNVIRYDVPTSGYTGSKADTPENAEVFGVIESYIPTTSKFNVVMSGSVDLDSSKFAAIPTSPSGAGGGNDIYFLSGITAGVLQNLAPANIDHITKPVYQVAPHGTYSGSVINYSGYRLGGDIQAGLDTVNILARVGSLQFIFDATTAFDAEEQRLRQFGFDNTGTDVWPIFQLDPAVAYDWKLESIRMDTNYVLLRKIDFPDVTNNVFPIINGGWVERVKVDSGTNITRSTVRGKAVQQFNNQFYNDSAAESSWYGQVLDWDETTRYLYILRPTVIDPNLMIDILNYMANPALPLTIRTTSTPQLPSATGTILLQTVPITSTNRSIQFVGFVTPTIKFTGEGTGQNYPFYFQTIYDPFNTNTPETVGVYAKVYMKIKNRGVSLVIPDNVTATELSANAITLANTDLQTTINALQARIQCLERGQTCP